MFSVCLCTWDDLPYLKLLVQGLRRNTVLPYELIVHVNGSTDGTIEFLQEQGIQHTVGPTNEGTAAVNYAAKQAKYPYVVDINADMYPLPGWDTAVYEQIKKFESEGINKFVISSRLIQTRYDAFCVHWDHFGKTPETLDEEALLRAFEQQKDEIRKKDLVLWFHPITMPKVMWDEIGGMDPFFFPGHGSDEDIIVKAYKHGCRHFIGLGNSWLFHFVSATNVRAVALLKKDGHTLMKEKWGFSIGDFQERLHRGGEYRPAGEDVFVSLGVK